MMFLAERLLRFVSNLRRSWEGVPPLTDQQWRLDRTLMQRSVIARRVYFALASGAIYNRDPAAIAARLTRWDLDDDGTLVSEADVVQAFTELEAYGLVDRERRPRMMYDIVE